MKRAKLESKKQTLISIAYFFTIILIIIVTVKYIIPFFMPFVIGFSIAVILKPISKAICKHNNTKSRICGTLVIILTYILATFLFFFTGSKMIEAIQFFCSSPNNAYENYILPFISKINEMTISITYQFFPNLTDKTSEILNLITKGINQTIYSISESLIFWVIHISMSIPNFLIGLMFSIMSSIFISSDYANIMSFLTKLLPENKRSLLLMTKIYTINTVLKYIKAYLILMFLTFIELVIGFSIIGIKNPIGIAALTSICDTIPLIGSGIVILPWCLISFATGNLQLALGLIILNVIISVVRSFLEPKILGKQLGIHPLATLVLIYVGIKLFGVLGMIFLPIATQIFILLYKSQHKSINTISSK